MFKKIIVFISCIFLIQYIYAQNKIIESINEYASKYENEKIYIHFDKNNYVAGETIWFKLYLFSGLNNPAISKTVYVDFYNDNNESIGHFILPVIESSAKGSFIINDTFQSKNIFLVAYTKRMVLLDSTFIFKKSIPIISNNVPSNQIKKDAKMNVQFFPESGFLINGIENKMAFKATNNAGLPEKIRGIIKDYQGKFVDSFKSIHNGMGYIHFTPTLGKKYMAIYKNFNTFDTIKIPTSINEGIQMNIQDDADSFIVQIQRTNNIQDNLKKIQLLVTQLYTPIYLANIQFKSLLKVRVAVSKSDILNGLIRFTILTEDEIPIAERVAFNYLPETIPISPELYIKTKNLKPRGKNEMEFILDDIVPSNFSMSITDADLTLDTSESNIYTHIFLESEIKGKVFKPDYYFNNVTDETLKNLDLVMLTNGWRKYNWQAILQQKSKIDPTNFENGYLQITGKVFGQNFNSKHTAQKQTINAIVETSDKSKNIFLIPIDSNSSFKITDLIFFDSCKLYYGFNKNTNEDAFVQFQKPSILLAEIPRFDYHKENFNLINVELNKNYTTWLNQLNINKKAILLETINLKKTKTKTRIQELDDKYTSGLFSGGDARSFDLENDIFAQSSTDIFSYIRTKAAGLNVETNSNGEQYFTWRGSETIVYLDGNEQPTSFLNTITLQNIAYLKIFSPPFFGSSRGGGGAIALYTKRGYDNKKNYLNNTTGLRFKSFNGYNSFKEFYIPTLEELNEVKTKITQTTLYWNPYILLDKKTKVLKFEFFNNDITNKFKIVVEGVNANGQFLHFEKIVQ